MAKYLVQGINGGSTEVVDTLYDDNREILKAVQDEAVESDREWEANNRRPWYGE